MYIKARSRVTIIGKVYSAASARENTITTEKDPEKKVKTPPTPLNYFYMGGDPE
jgi:hypothetical protein